MNLYHYHLNTPIKFVPNFFKNGEFRNPYPNELINLEFADWLKSLGVRLTCGEQLLLKPDGISKYNIHVDGTMLRRFIKMNFVYCDTPHYMNWYKIKPGKELQTIIPPVGLPYSECLPEDCDLVYTATVGKPSLVNVMELHDVSQVKSERYCFSFLLFKLSETPTPLTWADAEEIFKDYLEE